MNAERLLQHFERISEAPDAIPRLRRFILDLAVRGKLVEQDPNDAPAEELLKLISKGGITPTVPPGWIAGAFRRFLKKNLPHCSPRQCGWTPCLPPAGGGWRGEHVDGVLPRAPPPAGPPPPGLPRWGEVTPHSRG